MSSYKCDKCRKEFEAKQEAVNHEKNCKEKKKFRFLNKKIIEFKCKCKECGHVWHYLKSEEKRAKSSVFWNACGNCSTCGCLPSQIFFQSQANKWQNEVDKFKKCPKCGSVNIIKKEVKHEND